MQIYLVGGAIRDRLLGFSPPYENDWVVVNARPDDLEKKGYKKVGKSFPVYINPETGEVFEPNETRIEVLKAKPKALGKPGKVSLYYDVYSSRYYEMNDGGIVWSKAKPYHLETNK